MAAPPSKEDSTARHYSALETELDAARKLVGMYEWKLKQREDELAELRARLNSQPDKAGKL